MDELLAEVKAARRADSALQRHTDRVKELLIQVRRENPGLKLADLETRIGKFYDRATISRITVPELRKTADDS
jgi:hypothetical protein